MNPTLTPEQQKAYFSSQGTTVKPLSPAEFLASQATSFPAYKAPEVTPVAPAIALGKPIPEVKLPPPAPQPDFNAIISGQTQTLTDAQTRADALQAQQDTSTSEINKRLAELQGKTAYQQQQEDILGIPQQQKEIQELTNQIQAIGNETKAQQLALEGQGRGIPQAIIGGQQAQVGRENAIKALTLSAQLSAKQGNLAIATQQAQRAVDLKFAPIEQEIKNKLQAIELNAPNLTKAEKKVADATAARLKLQQEQIEGEKETEKSVNEIAITAGKNGASPALMAQISTAKSVKEALSKSAGYLKDPSAEVEMQIKKAQLANIYSQIAERGKDGTVLVDPNAKVILKPADATKINKEIANTDQFKAINTAKLSLDALIAFEKAFDKYGLEGFPGGGKAELRTKYNTATLNLKEFFNLGVLNGPDLEIIKGILPDPTLNVLTAPFSTAGGRGSAVRAGIEATKKNIETSLDERFRSLTTQYGDISPESVGAIKDLNRTYITQKASLNPSVAKLVKENPSLSPEEIISVISLQ